MHLSPINSKFTNLSKSIKPFDFGSTDRNFKNEMNLNELKMIKI